MNQKGGLGGKGGRMVARARGWPRRGLAFARSAEPQTAPPGRWVAVDVGLAAAAAVASLVSVIYTARGQASVWLSPNGLVIVPGGHIPVVAAFSVAVTTAPLALRRIRPLTVFWVVFSGAVLTNIYLNTVTFIAIVLAAYSAVVHSRYRGAALISPPLAGLLVTVIFPDSSPPVPGRIGGLFVLVSVALVGNAVQMWQRRVDDSQARLRHAQAEHEVATARALAAERTRIAGELHDVVTHNVSVMVVQAGAARRVLAASPEEATTALLAVEASGRTAMIELQHLLGLLSPVDGMHSPGEEPLRPQPGLDRLRPLIDRVAAVGLPAELTVSGRPRALPPGLDLAAYRVVQEALTNVMKHAGQARTAVRLDYRPDELIIDVSDDGPPGTGPERGRPDPGVRPSWARAAGGSAAGRDAFGQANLRGEGRGLLGLRERVSLYGGEFDAGPRPAGGWRVTARLPLDALNDQPADGADGGPAQGSPLARVPARP
ncbi:MAG TPA: sensor histidine kinase [Streptosporangiaceae bacterium]|nr:sensor histidine kinase [Streptosporangiaceae bacterium]